MKKLARSLLAIAFVSLLTAAVVYAGQTVTFTPFQPDPGDNLSHGEYDGGMNAGYTTMDVIPGGIAFSTLSSCSMLFEGPASRHYAVRVPMLSLHMEGMEDRICGYDFTIVEQIVIPGSKQTFMCRTNPNPTPPGAINIRYTYKDLCPPF